MRPVRRGISPRDTDFSNYKKAKTELISRLGSGWINNVSIASYCSYCERKIDTNLAVEHIEPKDGPFGKPLLSGRWDNFLLACINCNSTKGAKQVILTDIYLPDRDNTFVAFKYQADGNIKPSDPTDSKSIATLALVGLDKASREAYDQKGNLIAQDRASQRLNIWGIAESSLEDYNIDTTNEAVKRLIVKNMVLSGFFSVWMTVFKECREMKNLFIDALHGTAESGCFDPKNANVITPHPNLDGLKNGGKI